MAYVASTAGTASGNPIKAYRYYPNQTSPGGGWTVTSKSYTNSGATLKANAMTGNFVPGTSGDYVLVARRISGIDDSYMLLTKLDFFSTPADYATAFAWDAGSTAFKHGEALAIDLLWTDAQSLVPDFIAISGWSYRDSSYGNDSIVLLYADGATPTLRWSAWLNLSDTAYAVHDACTTVKVGWPAHLDPSDPDSYGVYVAGQLPTSTSDLDWRVAVFSADTTGADPDDPSTKSTWGNTLTLSGSASGGDIPRDLCLNPFGAHPEEPCPPTCPAIPAHHRFIVVGDVWDGTTYGFDIKTRHYQFFEPD